MPTDAVAAAAALTPLITRLRTETEAERKLPQAIVDGLTSARLWRMALSADLGGLELSPVEMLRVYETLAKTEASVAWVVWNNALPCFFGRFLPDKPRREIFAGANNKHAISTRPTGRARLAGDGYRLSGRWSLVSGCMHANWLALMCLVEENGAPVMVAPGAPAVRLAFLPATECRIVDTWHVGGLRGTGSHDVVVDDRPVPAERTFSPMDSSRIDQPIGRMPIICTMMAGHAALCLGIAQAATDVVVDLARKKGSVDAGPGMRDRSTTQLAVTTAIAKLAAYRTQLHLEIGKLWQIVDGGATPTPENLADVWGVAITTSRECRLAFDEIYEAAGTTALYTDSILERGLRDIHAAMQHVVVQRGWLEDAARVRFGLAATNPLFAL